MCHVHVVVNVEKKRRRSFARYVNNAEADGGESFRRSADSIELSTALIEIVPVGIYTTSASEYASKASSPPYVRRLCHASAWAVLSIE